MVTKDYSKSRMRENRTYGSVRGGQSNLIPSTRLTGLWPRGFLSLTAAMPLRVVVGASKFIEGASLYKTFTTGLRPWENHTTALRASEMHPFWWLAPPPSPRRGTLFFAMR